MKLSDKINQELGFSANDKTVFSMKDTFSDWKSDAAALETDDQLEFYLEYYLADRQSHIKIRQGFSLTPDIPDVADHGGGLYLRLGNASFGDGQPISDTIGGSAPAGMVLIEFVDMRVTGTIPENVSDPLVNFYYTIAVANGDQSELFANTYGGSIVPGGSRHLPYMYTPVLGQSSITGDALELTGGNRKIITNTEIEARYTMEFQISWD